MGYEGVDCTCLAVDGIDSKSRYDLIKQVLPFCFRLFNLEWLMSSTSTEHALTIPEIVHQIFLVLGPQPLKHQRWRRPSSRQETSQSAFAFSDCDRQTLASAARCCKRFSELALDVLWWFQASVLPLLSVLPPFKKSSCDAVGHVCTFPFYDNRSDSLFL